MEPRERLELLSLASPEGLQADYLSFGLEKYFHDFLRSKVAHPVPVWLRYPLYQQAIQVR